MADRPVRLKNGAVLTPELEEKLRQEAERGYDPAALRRVVRPGRPSRGEEGGESPRVSARVPEDVYRAASERRRARGPRSPTSSASCSLSTPAGAGARADGIAARRPPLRRLGDVVAEHRVVGGNDVGQLVGHDGSERDPSSQDVDPQGGAEFATPPRLGTRGTASAWCRRGRCGRTNPRRLHPKADVRVRVEVDDRQQIPVSGGIDRARVVHLRSNSSSHVWALRM